MNWEAIGAIGELLGAAGVIATLGYLAFQIRQNNRHLAQEAQRARAQSVRETYRSFADNAEIWVKDLNGETLTAVESQRITSAWMGTLFSYQTSFQQLPREQIEGMANFFRRSFETMQSIRTPWEQNRDTFHTDFVQWMEENVVNER